MTKWLKTVIIMKIWYVVICYYKSHVVRLVHLITFKTSIQHKMPLSQKAIQILPGKIKCSLFMKITLVSAIVY